MFVVKASKIFRYTQSMMNLCMKRQLCNLAPVLQTLRGMRLIDFALEIGNCLLFFVKHIEDIETSSSKNLRINKLSKFVLVFLNFHAILKSFKKIHQKLIIMTTPIFVFPSCFFSRQTFYSAHSRSLPGEVVCEKVESMFCFQHAKVFFFCFLRVKRFHRQVTLQIYM